MMRYLLTLVTAGVLGLVTIEEAAALKCPITCAAALRSCIHFKVRDKLNFDCEGQLRACLIDGSWHGPYITCSNLVRQ